MTITGAQAAAMTVDDMVEAYRCWERGEDYVYGVGHGVQAYRQKELDRLVAISEEKKHKPIVAGITGSITGTGNLYASDFGREDPRVVLQRGTDAVEEYMARRNNLLRDAPDDFLDGRVKRIPR